jgi:hypothetical protein
MTVGVGCSPPISWSLETDFAVAVFISYSFAGIGIERKQNGSNLMLTFLHVQVNVDLSWPCIKSTMMLSFRFKYSCQAT